MTVVPTVTVLRLQGFSIDPQIYNTSVTDVSENIYDGWDAEQY